mgnify:CR=1 FL=1
MERYQTGRFYNAFVVKMIRDFFLLLVVLLLIEVVARLCISLYNYHNDKREDTQQAADQLSSDIKDIMLNSGGPVASRTVYPILSRNYERMGYQIAVEPSEVTRTSIKEQFGRSPEGIPASWPQGEHQTARRVLTAEPFCLNCHIHASVGDPLGHVEVRRYLNDHLDAWGQDIRLSGMITMSKIGLDILILYLLLRVRMEPLLRLRSVVSSLTKSNQGLSHRVKVTSNDEFGELALNVNDFLDRINQVMGDLLSLLNKVVAVNQRLSEVNRQLTGNFTEVEACIKAAQEGLGRVRERCSSGLSAEFERLGQKTLALRTPADAEPLKELMGEITALRTEVDEILSALGQEVDKPLQCARDSGIQVRGYLNRMQELENQLSELAQEGRTLLNRLS